MEENQELITEEPVRKKYKTTHEYGAWSCPDNLRGFPAVDLRDINQIPVVNDRLPTEEETKDGTSLILFDTEKYPDARPLEMTMPRLARYYSEYTKKNELVIVIQATIAERDTVVGFRYLNGGNGSAWFGEIEFVSEEEIEGIGSTPFAYFESQIDASQKKIWDVITNPIYAKTLGSAFGENMYMESAWQRDSKAYLKNGANTTLATGLVTASWFEMYMQVDYNIDGHHYVEKFLILNDQESGKSFVQMVAGPFGEDYDKKISAWEQWFQKVIELSERDVLNQKILQGK